MGTVAGKDLESIDEDESISSQRIRSSSSSDNMNGSDKPLHMRKGSKEWLTSIKTYLECRRQFDTTVAEIDPRGVLRGMSLYSHSGVGKTGITSAHSRFQQQNVTGRPAANVNEVINAANQAAASFHSILNNLKNGMQNGSVELVLPELKKIDRVVQKGQDDYASYNPGPPESWVYDVLRASVLCTSTDVMEAVVVWLYKEAFIVTAKNRFQDQTPNGYRDLLFNIRIRVRDETGLEYFHFCELQVHHEKMYYLAKRLKSHEVYRYFRELYRGNRESVEKYMKELEAIADSGHLDTVVVHQVLEGDDVERIQRLSDLFHSHLPEQDFALLLSQRALDLHAAKRNDVDMACSYNHIGTVLLAKGEYESSLEHYEKALEIFLETIDAHDDRIAQTRNNIGAVLFKQSKFDSALKEFHRALDVFASSGDKENAVFAEQARSLSSIGNVYRAKGHPNTALEQYQNALDICESLHGEENEAVRATTLGHVGAVRYDQGLLEDAKDCFGRVLKIRQTVLGRRHPHTAQIHEALGTILRDLGDLDAAASELRLAQDIFESTQVRERPILRERKPVSMNDLPSSDAGQ